MEKKIDLILEWIGNILEEKKSKQKIHRFFYQDCKKCKERDELIKRIKEVRKR